MTILFLVIACGLLSILYAIWATRSVLAADQGNARMQEIAGAIREGAQAYLARQYTTIAIVGVVVFLAAWYLLVDHRRDRLPDRRRVVGRLPASSACTSLFAPMCARRRQHPEQPGRRSRDRVQIGRDHRHAGGRPRPAWRLDLLLYPDWTSMGHQPNDRVVIDSLVSLGFGASLISIFARLGGGIFTKGADVGGDLVGKVEAGIPEDDPRNPATIADNVGDNVGDCAGMAADLFETYAVTVVATMVLGAIFFGGTAVLSNIMLYPLAICGACILTSIVGTFFVKLGSNDSIMGALYKGLIVTGLLSIAGLGLATSITLGWGEIGTVAGIHHRQEPVHLRPGRPRGDGV
jgi:K(+)-stimulated pyrophosphate-energized sodium pump